MGYVRLLRSRPVLVLWAARSLAALGERVASVAVIWSVYASTGSVSLMGLVSAVESLPYVVLGVTGRRLIVRFSSPRALSGLEGARAAVAVGLPFLWSPDGSGLAVLLLGMLLLGVLGALFDPNMDALVPALTEVELVQPVTGLFDLTGRIAHVVGRSCAGLLLTVFPKVQLFALNGAAFAVSALALGWSARAGVTAAEPRSPTDGASPRTVPARSLLRRHPRVALAVGVHALVPLTSAAVTVGLPVVLAGRGGADAGRYGLVTAMAGIGALVGNPLAGRLRPRNWFALCCAAWVVDGAAAVGMATAEGLPGMALMSFVTGAAAPVGAVTLRARLGRFPAAERVRLMTVEHTAVRLGSVAGILAVPVLVGMSPRGSFLVVGSVIAVTALAASAVPAGRGRGVPAPQVVVR
ncbi:hypothetical protein CTZ27_10705 [Streptomyces griseocarneus]|nr:hypothetical protein CTZ27_10705 [Streptomyces griseocarneus]